jgi:translation initiation factor 2 alpha subunit (eIF-2alpha)
MLRDKIEKQSIKIIIKKQIKIKRIKIEFDVKIECLTLCYFLKNWHENRGR